MSADLPASCTRPVSRPAVSPRISYGSSSCQESSQTGLRGTVDRAGVTAGVTKLNVCTSRDRAVRKRLHSAEKISNGTPGFKALECLISSNLICSSCDIFAAGAIFICLLLRKHAFFMQNTPADGIFEMCCLYGFNRVKEEALNLGMNLKITTADILLSTTDEAVKVSLSSNVHMQDMSNLYEGTWLPEPDLFHRLRRTADLDCFSLPAFDLLAGLLALSPAQRISSEGALSHSFLQ